MDINLLFEDLNDKSRNWFKKNNLTYLVCFSSISDQELEDAVAYIKTLYGDTNQTYEILTMGSPINLTNLYQNKNVISIIIVKSKYMRFAQLTNDNIIFVGDEDHETLEVLHQIYNLLALNHGRKRLEYDLLDDLDTEYGHHVYQYYILDNYRFPYFMPGEPLGCIVIVDSLGTIIDNQSPTPAITTDRKIVHHKNDSSNMKRILSHV